MQRKSMNARECVGLTPRSLGSVERHRKPGRRRAAALQIASVAVLLFCVGAGPATGPAEEAVGPNVDRAVNRGLAFLVKQQAKDGSMESPGPRAAMTGLTLMSLLAAGHTPDSGKYAPQARAAADYLVTNAPKDGYYSNLDGSRMYGQGIIALALAEVCGVETDPARRAAARTALARSIEVILAAQAIKKQDLFAGGWRYERTSPDSDLSLSGWMAMALRGARNAGLPIDKAPIEQAVGFVGRCWNAAEKGYAYQPGGGASTAMTGVALLNLHLLEGDLARRPELAEAARFLIDHPVNDDTPMSYYAYYYSAQGAFQAGEAAWTTVWKRTRDHLLDRQDTDGGWPQSKRGEEPGRVYATAMSVLTLTIPYRLLPVYQR